MAFVLLRTCTYPRPRLGGGGGRGLLLLLLLLGRRCWLLRLCIVVAHVLVEHGGPKGGWVWVPVGAVVWWVDGVGGWGEELKTQKMGANWRGPYHTSPRLPQPPLS